MSIELSIHMKDDERKLVKDFLIYEPLTLTDQDPTIVRCVKEVREEFKGEPEDIIIKAKMIMR